MSLGQQSRSRFLSSSAAAFLASGAVLASDPESCDAAKMEANPRYIDRDLEMKYGEDKGTYAFKMSVKASYGRATNASSHSLS